MTALPKTFRDFDKCALEPFSRKLESFIFSDYRFADGAFVLGLHGPFGSGKSTFLEMWKESLEQRRKSDGGLPTVVLLNAWEDDFCDDPFLSIMATFTELIGKVEVPPEKKDLPDKILMFATKVAKFGLNVVNQWAKEKTGYDFGDALKAGKGGEGT